MAIDMKTYIGAFMDEYMGSFSGDWATRIANIYTGITSLSPIIPGHDSPGQLTAFGGTRTKSTPSTFEVALTSSVFERSVEYPVEAFKLDTLGVYENNVRELARKAKFHFNKLAATVITTNGTCSD